MNYTQWYSQNNKLEKHEQWLVDNLMLETIVGSRSYGCETEKSDYDILSIVLPKYEHLFPQKYGFILGYNDLPNFKRKEIKGKKVFIIDKPVEIEWISLIEFFVQTAIKGSPNLIECLFVRKELVTVGTKMGYYLRDNRKLFLSMKNFHSFKGYANGQMHRIRQRHPETEERKLIIEKFGYDLKMAMHTLRLIDQLEQILVYNDLDLMRNKEEYKLMRVGEWGNFDRFEKEFQKRMDYLQELSRKCCLPTQPQDGALKKLLTEILEEHYKDIDKTEIVDEYVSAKDIKIQLDRIELTLSKLNEK